MIVLKGDDSDVLSITLFDIIENVPIINKYKWKLLWIDGVSRQFNIGKLMESVNNCEDGYFIKPTFLVEISKLADQLIELVLIGDDNINNLHKLDDELLKEKCEFFIELVDSSYWEITSKNEEFIENIKRNLADI